MSEPTWGYPPAGAQMNEMLSRSRSAIEELNSAARHGLEAMAVSVQTAQNGAEAVRAQTMSYCQQLADDAAAAARELASAKTPVEAFQVQANYSRRWFEGYMAAMGEISKTIGASVQASMNATQSGVASEPVGFSTRPPHAEGGES